MLTKMTAFLARAPALQGLSLTVGDVGPAPYTAGLWCRGITVLDRRENLLGRVTQRCRAEFTLRLCLPRTEIKAQDRLGASADPAKRHRHYQHKTLHNGCNRDEQIAFLRPTIALKHSIERNDHHVIHSDNRKRR